MNKFILALTLIASLAAFNAKADVYVDGYTRKDGTYVQPHHRFSPDSTPNNNWSTQGNTNPYTGEQGTKPIQPYGGSNSYGGSLNGSSNDSLYGSNGSSYD